MFGGSESIYPAAVCILGQVEEEGAIYPGENRTLGWKPHSASYAPANIGPQGFPQLMGLLQSTHTAISENRVMPTRHVSLSEQLPAN